MKKNPQPALLFVIVVTLAFFILTGAVCAQAPAKEGELVISEPSLPAPAPESARDGAAELGSEIPAWKARWELARLLAYSKSFDESLEQYRKLLAEKPELNEARSEMAKVLFWAGKRGEALKILEGLDQAGQDSETLLLKADLLATQKRYAEAEKLYRSYLDAKPADWAVRFKLAQILSWDKKYPPALREYEAILKARPNDIQVRRNYAFVLSWSGKHKQAAEELKKTLGD